MSTTFGAVLIGATLALSVCRPTFLPLLPSNLTQSIRRDHHAILRVYRRYSQDRWFYRFSVCLVIKIIDSTLIHCNQLTILWYV